MTSQVRHVDIISNDPLAGEERLIARVWLNGGPELELVLPAESATNKDSVWSYLTSRVQMDPKEDPGAFLEALPLAIDATYVVASRVHETIDCPFAESYPHLAG